MRLLLTSLLLITCLAGCGQKGGLYIPQEESASAPAPAPAPAK